MQINDRVEVVLTKFGAEVLEEHHNGAVEFSPGRRTFQLWELFIIFGEVMGMGSEPVFEGGLIKPVKAYAPPDTQTQILDELRAVRRAVDRQGEKGEQPVINLGFKPRIDGLYGRFLHSQASPGAYLSEPAPKSGLDRLMTEIGAEKWEGLVTNVTAGMDGSSPSSLTVEFRLTSEQALRAMPSFDRCIRSANWGE